MILMCCYRKVCAELERNGLSGRCISCDEIPFDDFVKQPTVIFVISTSGQGKFPLNAKQFWNKLSLLSDDESLLNRTQFAIFGLGDSHFWKPPLGTSSHSLLFFFFFSPLYSFIFFVPHFFLRLSFLFCTLLIQYLGKIYFCKPAKDLDKRLVALGALQLAPLCCGDDQVNYSTSTFYFTFSPLFSF